ncbi:MAG: polyprenyl synthetase family protein [Candidatus Fimenecus sp.]
MCILDLQQKYLDMVNRSLETYVYAVTDGQNVVRDAMLYSLQNGGKRVRPMLTLAFCEVCGGNPQNALPFACAVEMIHTYSLIHDDLPCMDDDDLRRGKPSCHKQFGEANALLAGDGLLTLAFETVTKAENIEPADIVRAVRVLSNLAGYAGMIGGQVIDLLSEEKTVDYDTLHRIDKLKTGALIKAAALLGCIAAGVTDETVLHAAAAYAENIGFAFQVVDDILDVTADTQTLGKPVGSDEKNEKSTFVKLLGLEKSRQLANDLTDSAVKALKTMRGDTSFLNAFAKALAVRNQ